MIPAGIDRQPVRLGRIWLRYRRAHDGQKYASLRAALICTSKSDHREQVGGAGNDG